MKPKAGCPWAWLSVLHSRDTLKSNGRWSVRSGENINITKDLWLASGNKVMVRDDGSVVSRVSELIDLGSHYWNIQALRVNLSFESAVNAYKTPIGWTDPTNDVFCPIAKDGNFSIKTI